MYFLFKITERATVSQLSKYLLVNNLNKTQQSAFKCGHSIETTLLRVKNDIMMSIDQNKAVLLVLLDLSIAFNRVDDDVPFFRLENYLVCREVCLTSLRHTLRNVASERQFKVFCQIPCF